MLEVFIRIICAIIMTMVGFYTLKKILNSNEKVTNIYNSSLLILLIILSSISFSKNYQSLYTITVFFLNIIIYKLIFKENLSKVTIATSLLMALTFLADLIYTIIIINFISMKDIRSIWYYQIISNICIAIICLLGILICQKLNLIKKINQKLEKMQSKSTIIFLILIIIVFTILAYSFYINFQINEKYIINILLLLIFIILLLIFLKERDNYNKLSTEYDSLFTYVQTFEDWIEKEQLNRHEYKNQLAVLRCLTEEKKVKDKIDEILEDNINIEGQAVTQLKSLPKGGIKGLMYYKAAIAQKKKINLTADVSIEQKGTLAKLNEKEIRIVCKLIGIYFDNAIEAAEESKRKNISIEIYEFQDKVNIVFSNTFKKHRNMKDRNKKGVSSKGKGRGNGLYFAEKLIKENPWIEEKQDIIDKYYIQKISINNKVIKNQK